jgi:aminoglycoside 6'-N-acetyltransferase
MDHTAAAEGDTVALASMTAADLQLVAAWLVEPHVARWYLSGSTLEDELEELRLSVNRERPTEVLLVTEGARPIGWGQWYLCSEYPDHARCVGAGRDDVGIDYAIGDPVRIGRGIGTAVVAALVRHVRERHSRAGVIADPEAANIASRRVLEKNGFELLGERPVASEPTAVSMAIYRLPPPDAGAWGGRPL